MVYSLFTLNISHLVNIRDLLDKSFVELHTIRRNILTYNYFGTVGFDNLKLIRFGC